MATAFSVVLAPGELSVTYTTTHAPLAAQSLCVRPRLAAHADEFTDAAKTPKCSRFVKSCLIL